MKGTLSLSLSVSLSLSLSLSVSPSHTHTHTHTHTHKYRKTAIMTVNNYKKDMLCQIFISSNKVHTFTDLAIELKANMFYHTFI